MPPRAGWIFALTIAAAACASPPAPPAARHLAPGEDRARSAAIPAALPSTPDALHRASVVVDGHNDITTALVDEGFDLGQDSAAAGHHTDLARLRAGGVTAEVFSIFVDRAHESGAARRAMAMIDATWRQVQRHPGDLLLATRAAEVRSAKTAGKIAVLMGIEGGHAIEGSLAVLRSFFRLGVRVMSLTHMTSNELGDAAGDAPRHRGLSRLGVEVVAEMQRLGMLVDVSHADDATFDHVLRVARAPVIASHSSARALAGHPRNLDDARLRALGANGGIAMINFYPGYLGAGRGAPVTVATVADHIEHAARVAGDRHVGLGSDFDGVRWLPVGMRGVDALPRITEELARRGWSPERLRGVLGQNFLRVLEAAEAHAAGR